MSSINDRILVISDLQAPFHHKRSYEFLLRIKSKYRPTRIINIGDECDFHGLNFHGINPDLPGVSAELADIQVSMKDLESIFPKMDLIESNHGKLPIRKAHAAGIPTAMLRAPAEIYGVSKSNWKWHPYLDIEVGKRRIRFVHNYESNALTAAKNLGMCLVQGHHHSKFDLQYWSNGNEQFWAATIGCLIDDASKAFNYNKTSSKRPVLGCLMIINGKPILEEFDLL